MPGRRSRILGLLTAAVLLFAATACDGPPVVSGHLTVAGSGDDAVGVSVTAYSSATESVVTEMITDTDGHYTFGEKTLPPGTYRLRFNRDVWYGGNDWSTATDVTATASAPPTVDAAIVLRTATVSGTMTSPQYGLCCNGRVEAINVLGGAPTLVKTVQEGPGAGTYTFPALPAGTYRFRFGIGNPEFKITVYSSSAFTASAAPTYSLAPGSTTTGVDTVLPAEVWQPEFVVADGDDLSDGVRSTVAVAIDAATSEPLEEIISWQPWSGGKRSLGIPATPIRILLGDTSGRLRTGFAGATAANPSGTVFTSPDLGPFSGTIAVLQMVGRDCDPAVYAPGADHSGEDLSDQILINCELAGADLTGSDLSGTDIHNADLVGADLTDTTFTGATSDGVDTDATTVYANTTCPDGVTVSDPQTCVGHGF